MFVFGIVVTFGIIFPMGFFHTNRGNRGYCVFTGIFIFPLDFSINADFVRAIVILILPNMRVDYSSYRFYCGGN